MELLALSPQFYTATALTALVNVLLSLVLTYIPGIRLKWAAKSSESKSGIIILVGLGVMLLGYGSTCAGIWDLGVPCTAIGARTLAELAFGYILAMAASVTTYTLSTQPADVRAVKLGRE